MKFRNYRNAFNNSNRIYSEDDIRNMTVQTLFDNENDVLAQNREIGIPTLDELQNSQNTQWIEPFVNNEGKNDGGYWQAIQDTNPLYPFAKKFIDSQTTYEPSTQNMPTIDQMLTMKGKVEYNNTAPVVPQKNNLNIAKPTVTKEGVEYNNNKPNSYIEKEASKNANLALNAVLLQTLAKNPMHKAALYMANTLSNKYDGLTPKAAIQKAAAKIPIWKSSEKEYYQHGLKLADGEEPTEFMKGNNDFRKIHEISDPKLRQIYIEKAAKMYGLDVNDPATYDAVKNTNIVMPKIDSQLHSQIKNSKTLQKWVAENYENIKNNTNKNKSLTFPITWENDNAQRSLGLTLHKTDMSNAKINEDGSFSVFPTDIPDYDHLEQKAYKIPNVNDKGEKLSIKDKAKEFGKILGYNVVADINNNALQQQEKEQYLKYLLSTDITYTKEEIEEILKRFKSLR